MSRVGRELRSARASVRRARLHAALWHLGWALRNLLELVWLGARYAWALRLPVAVHRLGRRGLGRAGRAYVWELWMVVRLPSTLAERAASGASAASAGRAVSVAPTQRAASAVSAERAAPGSGRLPSVQFEKQVPESVGAGALLQDARVRRLQEKAVPMICARYLGISVRRADAVVLGAYSSAAWVLRNIYTAAGIGLNGLGAGAGYAAGELATLSECRRRCEVVFPTVVRLLAMDQGAAHTAAHTGSSGAAFAIAGAGVTRSLYPQAVDVERYRRHAELLRANSRRRRKAGFLAAELGALGAYDIALTLLMQLPERHRGTQHAGTQHAGTQHAGTQRRAVQRLERIHSTQRSPM